MMYRNHEGYPDPTAGAALAKIEQEEYRLRCPFMPLVYICSPYQGNVDQNTLAAQRYSRFALENKRLPIAPHLLFPQFMNDQNHRERALAMFFNRILIGHCEAVWVYADHISTGMRQEISWARSMGLPIKYFTTNFEEARP